MEFDEPRGRWSDPEEAKKVAAPAVLVLRVYDFRKISDLKLMRADLAPTPEDWDDEDLLDP